MRKMILALVVVLIASPVWADVIITLEDLGDGVVQISYDATGETELVRAFALDVSTDGTIVDVNDYAVGDDNGGYGIFPANLSRFITVDGQTGEVADWMVDGYTPVADPNDPGAAGGIGDSAITLEMGSLYDTMAPGTTGVLCTVTVEGATTVSVTTNAMRGGVVMEDATEATVPDAEITLGHGECFPTDNPQYDDWVALGKPDCWCSEYQCDGDADGQDSGFPARFRVFLGDLDMIVANWQKRANDPTLDPCADIDHKDSGFPARFRVFLGDLNIVVENWQKRDSALAGDCPR